MSNLQLDRAMVAREIEELIAAVPEMAEDEDLRHDMLEGETGLHELVSRALDARADALGMADAIKQRMADLRERKERYDRRAKALGGLIHSLMEIANMRKLELPEATVSIRRAPDKVTIIDEAAIPPGFFRIRREVDRAALKKALATGEHVPGATLSNGGESISVRVK
ncbi:MAG: siphovirus Gp157 family protein [Mariprofundaceae bacterium]|nr:siphovirus Gp157 family protein [Mariprofundaceae bacterium]